MRGGPGMRCEARRRQVAFGDLRLFIAFSSRRAHARPGRLASRSDSRRAGMDFVFILIVAGLYATTHLLVWVVSRLGDFE